MEDAFLTDHTPVLLSGYSVVIYLLNFGISGVIVMMFIGKDS